MVAERLPIIIVDDDASAMFLKFTSFKPWILKDDLLIGYQGLDNFGLLAEKLKMQINWKFIFRGKPFLGLEADKEGGNERSFILSPDLTRVKNYQISSTQSARHSEISMKSIEIVFFVNFWNWKWQKILIYKTWGEQIMNTINNRTRITPSHIRSRVKTLCFERTKVVRLKSVSTVVRCRRINFSSQLRNCA
jgi:hypothetical protein